MAVKKRPAKERGTFRAARVSEKDKNLTETYSGVSSGPTVLRSREPGLTTPVETIETRLERKAAEADGKVFATESLGQMSYEERDKLLFGE